MRECAGAKIKRIRVAEKICRERPLGQRFERLRPSPNSRQRAQLTPDGDEGVISPITSGDRLAEFDSSRYLSEGLRR